MSVISLRSPVLLTMEVVEYVEAWPSMRVAVSIEYKHSGGFVNYKEEVWFECAVWDKFTKELNGFMPGGEQEIALSNLDEYFKLMIIRADESFVLRVKSREPRSVFLGADFSFKLDNDSLGQLRDSFNEFEKWW